MDSDLIGSRRLGESEVRRRDILALLAGAAAGRPFAAWADAAADRRRVGALMNLAADDPLARTDTSGFVEGLQDRGWKQDGNLQIDYRWGAGDADLYRRYAQELVGLRPDVILATGGTAVAEIQKVTRTVPIVFVKVTDPVSRGLVASLAKPGGNTTGFLQYEFGTAGKWLELLKQMEPNLRRVGVIRDVSESSGIGQMAAIQAVAPPFGIDVSPIDARDGGELERGIAGFASGSGGGLIVTESGRSIGNRRLIISLAAKHSLPAVYPYRYFAADGGLISYGPDEVSSFRAAASYVDRILKGEKPADLPVQAPTTYELVINLRAARALSLTIPPSLLARANEVIE